MPAVPGPGPPDHGLVLGPGQGDVGEAEVLAPLFGDVLVPVAIEIGAPLAADVDGAAVARDGVVEDRRGRPGEVARLPEVGGVDDGELEAFAPMDGEDLYCLGVGLEAPAALLVVGVFSGLGDPLPQPGGEGAGAELGGGGGGVEELADVAQVGELAFPVGRAQNPPG